jgi:pre-rRNA-processing protein TSR2
MELRSGQIVASQASISPAAPATITAEGRAAFEEGARHLFQRWTALNLAVEQQWGGPDSAGKAAWLVGEAVQWFYRNKGAQSSAL